MSVHSLAKILGLLSATVGTHVAYTSPNPPGDLPAVSSVSDRLLRVLITMNMLVYIKACLWCSALAESAVIFANAYPSLRISKAILENLLFGGNASQIQFTASAAAGIALGIAGGALRVWCYRAMGKYFTFEMSIMKDHNLVTTGPYSVVRHPSYTGAIMIAIANLLLHATKGSWVRESGLLRYFPTKVAAAIFVITICAVTLAALVRMNEEDRALRKEFRDKWDAWAARVRYMIIPGVL